MIAGVSSGQYYINILKTFNPFDTKRYAQNKGFYVLTDGHVMKATAIVLDLELMKSREVRGLPR